MYYQDIFRLKILVSDDELKLILLDQYLYILYFKCLKIRTAIRTSKYAESRSKVLDFDLIVHHHVDQKMNQKEFFFFFFGNDFVD